MAAILAACGGTSGGGSGGGGSTGSGGGGGGIDWNAEPNKALNFANWPLYIDKKKVNGQVTYPSHGPVHGGHGHQGQRTARRSTPTPEFFGKIQPQLAAGQSTGWDIIVITNGDHAGPAAQARTTWCRCPRTSVRTSTRTPAWRSQIPSYDPGNKFTMAWQSGLTGIGWDPEKVKACGRRTRDHERDGPVRPGVQGEDRHVRRQRRTCRTWSWSAWASIPTTSTPDDWQKAADLLTKQQATASSAQYYDQDYIERARRTATSAVTMAWSGDIFQVNLDGRRTTCSSSCPSEGVMIWTDNMCIPVGAEHPVDAITYMDYVYQPEVAGR